MSTWDTDILEIVPGTIAQYRKLAHYHYRPEAIWPATNIYIIRDKRLNRNIFPCPLAVMVYRMPIPCLRARNKATDNFFSQSSSKSERLKLVNKYIRYAARVIVDPRFRRLGLATWLIKDTIDKQGVPLIETLAPIDPRNAICTNNAFKQYYVPAPSWYQRFTDVLRATGLTLQSFETPIIVNARIENLHTQERIHFEKEIKHFLSHFRHRCNQTHSIERTEFILSKIPFPHSYMLYRAKNEGIPTMG